MNKTILVLLLIIPLATLSAQKDNIFLFSYFKGNGENGLHLAYSLDGLKFTALNDDRLLNR